MEFLRNTELIMAQLSFSEMNFVESTESIEFVMDYF